MLDTSSLVMLALTPTAPFYILQRTPHLIDDYHIREAERQFMMGMKGDVGHRTTVTTAHPSTDKIIAFTDTSRSVPTDSHEMVRIGSSILGGK